MVEQIKTARKKSEDPVQEALRQNKDNWNHEASLLIAQLIAFKKGLNGRGEPRVGIPPGSIKDPMPNEVGSYLDQLADRFNKLVSDAHHIIDEQLQYSETRKKSVKEQTASVFDDDIIKTASWWGSRALTYTKNQYLNPKYWRSADESVKTRMLMLKVSVDLIKQLKVIDNYVVSKDINSVPNAIYDFDKFISAFNKLLLGNIKKLSKLENENKEIGSDRIENKALGPTETPPAISEISKQDEIHRDTNIPIVPTEEPDLELSGKKTQEVELTAKAILDDIIVSGRLIQIMNLLGLNKGNINLFESGIKELRKVLDNIVISDHGSLEEANNSYSDLKELSSKILKVNDVSFSDQLNEAEKLLISKAGSVSPEFEKLAKNYLSRWLKRQKLKLLPNSDDRIRLEASNKIITLIGLVNSFQNILEKNEQNLDVIKDSFFAIGNELGELSDDLYYLGKTHNDEYEQNRLNGKPTTHLIKLNILQKLQKMKDSMSKLPAEVG